MKIVVYAIALNEAEFAERFIKSALDADEIVISLDTRSTDGTKEILSKYEKVKIYDMTVTPWRFDLARNFSLSCLPSDTDVAVCADLDDIFIPGWRKKIEDNWIVGRTTILNYPYIHAWEDKEQTIPRITIWGFKVHCPKSYYWEYPIHEILTLKNEKTNNIPEDFSPVYFNNIEGWMTDIELNFLYKLSCLHSEIAEIGSWKGRSTSALLQGCKGSVTAIDHFQGSDDVHDLTYNSNPDKIFRDFVQNTSEFSNLKIIRGDSTEAAKKFEDKSIDVTFIDGEHTYSAVLNDIKTWLPKTKKVICGHDFCDTWAEVKKAVIEIFGSVKTIDSIWYVDLEANREVSVVLDEPLMEHHPDIYRAERLGRIKIFENNIKDYMNDPRMVHLYARELLFNSQWQLALIYFNHYFKITSEYNEITQNGIAQTRSLTCRYIAQCLTALKRDPNEIMAWYLRSVGEFPYQREPWMWLGWAWINFANDGYAAYAAIQRGMQIINKLNSIEIEDKCWGKEAEMLLNQTYKLMKKQLKFNRWNKIKNLFQGKRREFV